MKVKHLFIYIILAVGVTMTTACEMDSNDNGALDGFWHLERIDTLATGGVNNTADDYLFASLPATVEVGRYHSWVVSTEGLPECIEPTAVSAEGQIMALRHRELDVRGIQFHPESVLTPDGRTMIGNWLAH